MDDRINKLRADLVEIDPGFGEVVDLYVEGGLDYEAILDRIIRIGTAARKRRDAAG